MGWAKRTENRTNRFLITVTLTLLGALPSLALPHPASADRATVPASARLRFVTASGQTPLELLGGRIASHIAGRTVTIDCATGSEWTAMALQTGGNARADAGFVATQWDSSTGGLISISSVAELSGAVCVPLADFAAARVKPKGAVAKPSAASSSRYSRAAIAILTLAHESIHLGGVVGGTLSNGLAVGDPQAEAAADCYGMQWVTYVAKQLGDTAVDAQALASYVWDTIYPRSRTSYPAYWSADCRPGGTLDARPHGATAWP